MKQLLLHLGILLLISYNTQAQNLVNGEFEEWDDLAGGFYTQPAGWSSLNVLALLSAPQTVTKTTDAFEGSFAARLETKTFSGNPSFSAIKQISSDWIIFCPKSRFCLIIE